ncbi:SNF2 family N-terminal domain containing protein [Tritrichomonas foetus]|uniref:SNF2 family N-terminal domain containing protein n=1 Tax=Tritrichomonas foetus TaxID=1144522 RepID=A0A1J4K1D9_9EUKA|nr:SNF2 family N-terminal domain containing protein [Tritrichomonas foetus]|eukprot:OHT05199.1 SNF2 family N-terminal domain containing protein [Tritrichomonas foetus]
MRSGRSNQGHYHSSDESSESDAYVPPEDLEIKPQNQTTISPRHSGRNLGHSVSYNELEENSDEYNSDDMLDPILGNGRIDHIYLSRGSSGVLEYLVSFQEASNPFSHWFQSDQLEQSSNFRRSVQKFNETEMKLQYYDTTTHEFKDSYQSPLHIISHRPLNDDTESHSLEFLCHFNLETGSTSVWEPNTADSPQNLIKNYLKTRVCVENTHPERPACLDIDEKTAKKFKSKDGFTPRNYQIAGVNWMLQCFCSNHGCILADEMGLGKTIQCLTFLMQLNRASQLHGPYLIAVRTNTFTQWCSEIERWSDLKYIAYSGSRETRDIIREYQMPYFDDNGVKVEGKYGFNILLVTYEIFLKDVDYFKKIDWQIIMIDEGHRIKNSEGKKHNALQSVPAMHRVILTGTPIQSTLLELWTLLNFVSPEYFIDSSMFPEDDVESLEDDVINELRSLIAPHLMRRSLVDVEKSIVPKDEKIVFLQLTEAQKELIRLTKMHELWRVKDGGDDTQSEFNMLHRICNHPFLIDGTEKYYQGRYNVSRLQLMIRCSSKFIFLDRVLPVFKKAGRSVLIFSQRLKILKLLSEYCKLKKYSHEMLIGSLTEAEKKEAISRFSDTKKDVFIFLISTRSGSEGLNLTKASITIIFDPDWNPQNDLQAQGRCHRIGQTQKVDVIRLLTYGTYEHEMFARAQRKLKLWDTLLGEGLTTDPSLAQKVEAPKQENHIDEEQTFTGNLMGSAARHDSVELEGIITSDILKATSTTEEVPETEIEPPPPITKDIGRNLSFEQVLSASSTVVHDIQLIAQQSRHFPEIDLSFGLSDEDFLAKFSVDPSISAAAEKRRNRTIIPRVQLDPKTAKRIIKFLEVHGYGEWESIHASINEMCPLEQCTRFCQAATILHLRAIDPYRISSFPLLLKQLQNDIPKFDISFAMNSDPSEWYSVFSKRSFLAGEASVCKHISNHIHKTALQFLARLEHHLLVSEWRKDDEHQDFPYDQLPLDNTRTLQMDTDLYESLVDGKPLSQDEFQRTAQILNVMKTQLLLRTCLIDAYIIPFWTKMEVSLVLSSLRNFGESLTGLTPRKLKSVTTILSKNENSITHMVKSLLSILSQRRPNCKDPIILSDELTNHYAAPPGIMEPIQIDSSEITATIKRILLNKFIRSALSYIEQRKPKMDQVVPGGMKWCTINDCVTLLKQLVVRGMDSLVNLLLCPEMPFLSHFTENDIAYLNTFNRSLLKDDSMLPMFLHNENKFYMFLKIMSGGRPQQKLDPKPGQLPPQQSNHQHQGQPGVKYQQGPPLRQKAVLNMKALTPQQQQQLLRMQSGKPFIQQINSIPQQTLSNLQKQAFQLLKTTQQQQQPETKPLLELKPDPTEVKQENESEQ